MKTRKLNKRIQNKCCSTETMKISWKILHINQIFIHLAMRVENGRIFLRLLKHLRVLSEWIYVLIFLLCAFLFVRCVIKIAAFKHFYGTMVIFHEIFTVLISLFIHPRPIYVCAKINPRKGKLVINIKRFRGVFTRWNFNSDFMISPQFFRRWHESLHFH